MRYLGLEQWREPDSAIFLWWPPDVFAATALLLRESGGYVEAARPDCDGRIRLKATPGEWEAAIRRNAEKWAAAEGNCPSRIVKLWKILQQHADTDVCGIARNDRLWQAIIELCCTADQACRGVGLPAQIFTNQKGVPNPLGTVKFRAIVQLWRCLVQGEPSTLCKQIHPSRAAVLPKMRCPQRGVTIRSLSHHVALCTGSDIKSKWIVVPPTGVPPSPRQAAPPPQRPIEPERRAYNVLLIPWPFEMSPSQFKPIVGHETFLRRLPEHYDLFSFHASPAPKDFRKKIDQLIQRSRSTVGPLDGLVFPEMAMSEAEFKDTFDDKLPAGIQFLVCGIYEPPGKKGLAANYAKILRRVDDKELFMFRQEKHHRWALDQSQISTYGIGSALDPLKTWWEATDLRERRLHFFALDDICVFTVLICEDLARPDPVGDIIRAVGPNLVVALLQDGPQLTSRWASRHATSLADDPGSSVLTVTSLGMSRLSRPPGRDNTAASRVIALWRDGISGSQEIALPAGSHGLVLTLTEAPFSEYTGDGRSDGGTAGSIRLSGVNPVKWDD